MRLLSSVVAVCMCLAHTASGGKSLAAFMAIGDWGGSNSKQLTAAKSNAAGMEKFVTAHPTSQFVLGLGDNFYDYGVATANDTHSDANWAKSWTGVFNGAKLKPLPWLPVLGNHDYGFNPQAQVDASQTYGKRWVMPARNWVQRSLLIPNASRHVSFVFFDSSPCVTSYRSTNSSKWDPKPPGASRPQWDKDHYNFPANIKAEPCQEAKLKTMLEGLKATDWKILVTHHRASEFSFDMPALVAKYNIDLFLNGHVHKLEHYTISAAPKAHFFTVGSGCVLGSPTEFKEQSPTTTLWEKYVHGFAGFFFEDDFNTLNCHLFNTTFDSLHFLSIKK